MNERNAELKAIRDAVNLYITGLYNGNVEMLKDAFHPKAMMYGAGGATTTIAEIEGLYNFVSSQTPPAKTGEPHQCFINSIHYAGNAATVEMVEESAHGNDYTNYFLLLKIGGKWTIVTKCYNTMPSTNPQT